MESVCTAHIRLPARNHLGIEIVLVNVLPAWGQFSMFVILKLFIHSYSESFCLLLYIYIYYMLQAVRIRILLAMIVPTPLGLQYSLPLRNPCKTLRIPKILHKEICVDQILTKS